MVVFVLFSFFLILMSIFSLSLLGVFIISFPFCIREYILSTSGRNNLRHLQRFLVAEETVPKEL